jgi:ABC-2 type transport system permease protein
MLAALRVELSKLVRQRLILAALGTLAVLVGLFAWGTWRFPAPRHMPGTAGGEFVVAGRMKTAELLCYTLLRFPVALEVLVPLMIATVAGGLLAGERAQGTLRTLLTRPVSRSALYLAKLVCAWLYALVLALFLGAFALGVGYAIFGGGDLVPLESGSLTILAEKTALVRLGEGYLLAGLALTAVASLGMFFSSTCDNPLTAAGLTVAFLLVCGALNVIPYFESWRPYLLTTHLSVGTKVFAAKVPWPEVQRSLWYLGGYSALAALAGGIIFWRRDVVS